MRAHGRVGPLFTGVLALGVATLTAPGPHAGAAVLGDVQSAARFVQHVAVAPVVPRMLMADAFTSGTFTAGRVPESRQFLSNTWEVPIGNWSIASGNAQPDPNGTRLALYDTGRSNLTVSATLIRQGVSNAGLAFRADASGTTYLLARFRNNVGGSAFLESVVAGRATVLASANNIGTLPTAILRVDVSDTTVIVRYNGVSIITHTLSPADQTTFGSLTRSGMWVSNSTAEFFDDFFIATWPPS